MTNSPTDLRVTVPAALATPNDINDTPSERVPSAAIGDHDAPTEPRTAYARALASGAEHGELEDGTTCAAGRLSCWDCGHGLTIEEWCRTLPEEAPSPGARLGAALAAEVNHIVDAATPAQRERLTHAVLVGPAGIEPSAGRTVGGGVRLVAVILDIVRPISPGPTGAPRSERITLAIGRAHGPAWGATVILDSRTSRDWPGELTQAELERAEDLLYRERLRLIACETVADRQGRSS